MMAGSGEIFESEFYIEKFKESLIVGKPLNVNCTTKIRCGDQFLQFTGLFRLAEGCDCVLQVLTPKEEPGTIQPCSLKIKLTNEELQNEIQSVINFLKRKRCPDSAIIILRKAATLYNERNSVTTMLLSNFSAYVTVQNKAPDGITIECSVEKFFFRSSWKIGFDVYLNCTTDSLDFIVNKKDKGFYNKVIKYMKILTSIGIEFEEKLSFWRNIMNVVVEEILIKTEIEILDDDDTMITLEANNKRNIRDSHCSCSMTDEDVVELEISDSEDDNVVVVE